MDLQLLTTTTRSTRLCMLHSLLIGSSWDVTHNLAHSHQLRYHIHSSAALSPLRIKPPPLWGGVPPSQATGALHHVGWSRHISPCTPTQHSVHISITDRALCCLSDDLINQLPCVSTLDVDLFLSNVLSNHALYLRRTDFIRGQWKLI